MVVAVDHRRHGGDGDGNPIPTQDRANITLCLVQSLRWIDCAGFYRHSRPTK